MPNKFILFFHYFQVSFTMFSWEPTVLVQWKNWASIAESLVELSKWCVTLIHCLHVLRTDRWLCVNSWSSWNSVCFKRLVVQLILHLVAGSIYKELSSPHSRPDHVPHLIFHVLLYVYPELYLKWAWNWQLTNKSTRQLIAYHTLHFQVWEGV